MKVINLSECDWANFAHDNAMSLRAVGVSCESLTLKVHPFGYEATSRLVTREQMVRAIAEADVVQAFHSPMSLVDVLSGCKKTVTVYHTGTGYRQSPSVIHDAFKGFVASTVCALPELYLASKKLGADPVYLVGGIAIPEKILFRTPKAIRVAHHPSNPKVKGTETLRPILEKYRARVTTDRVPYERQLQRLENCDVYVEMMAPMQGEAQYGSFGITALEAAARGKIVLTNCVHSEVYREHYGEEPFFFCNDLASLQAQLDFLTNLNTTEILKLKHALHERFIQLHSHAETGKYILNNVLSRIF